MYAFMHTPTWVTYPLRCVLSPTEAQRFFIAVISFLFYVIHVAQSVALRVEKWNFTIINQQRHKVGVCLLIHMCWVKELLREINLINGLGYTRARSNIIPYMFFWQAPLTNVNKQ